MRITKFLLLLLFPILFSCESFNPPKWIWGKWKCEYINQVTKQKEINSWEFKKNYIACNADTSRVLIFKNNLFINYSDKIEKDSYIIRFDMILDKKPAYQRFKKIADNEIFDEEMGMILYRTE